MSEAKPPTPRVCTTVDSNGFTLHQQPQALSLGSSVQFGVIKIQLYWCVWCGSIFGVQRP